MEIDLPAPEVVEDPRRLESLVAELRRAPAVAVDTEADSFFSYREKVCLVQLSTRERDWLVDPLAGLDLAPLGELLADPDVRKVFHDGEYDVLILKREHGFEFRNLFDTRVAAAALGSPNPGLASVLEAHFGLRLDKAMQRSNWGARPLEDRQIAYAQLDTHYLLDLMDRQVEELERLERRMVVDAECARLERLEPVPARFDPDEWVRVKGARTLTPPQRRALRELFVARDELSRDADVPPFRVVQNPALVEVARAMPRNVRELSRVGSLSHGQLRRHGEVLMEALRRARELGPITTFPTLPPRDGTAGLDETQVELYERLKTWRKGAAGEMDMDASLVVNRHALVEIARRSPRDVESLAEIDELADWQLERFGEELVRVVERFRRDLAAGKVEVGRRRRSARR